MNARLKKVTLILIPMLLMSSLIMMIAVDASSMLVDSGSLTTGQSVTGNHGRYYAETRSNYNGITGTILNPHAGATVEVRESGGTWKTNTRNGAGTVEVSILGRSFQHRYTGYGPIN